MVDVSLPHGPQPSKSQVILTVLGGGGAYLEIDETCPVGMLVLLRFKLPGDDEEVVCQGTVCDVVDREGVGLEFLDIRSKDRDRLVEFVERHTADV